ncbi:hypothetical protein C488_09117 [Natrinema pellirubrum DSM 15624]|uniref:Uncharacterized protein n=2 Tax=Natrinema pellirubrum (strain DSM 15624 / CIP 106293 / JCM 10476 / NCIMB 786 / 157) TaxID=797303 RepID=L9YNU4_NATP1|nr:hypothetical protein [Natrinema pellirubrum]ELY75799.1 hypothetical protein C488_09117 [Natrinema pellirubrum DSM 15624]
MTMPPSDGFGDRLRVFGRVGLDAMTYAIAVAALTGIGALIIGVATGGGVVRAKALLFVAGWLLLAYATVRLWPTSPDDVGPPSNRGVAGAIPVAHDSTRFQSLVRSLPPLRWIQLPPPEKRLTPPGKLLLGSLLVLLLSFLMETAFGVG